MGKTMLSSKIILLMFLFFLTIYTVFNFTLQGYVSLNFSFILRFIIMTILLYVITKLFMVVSPKKLPKYVIVLYSGFIFFNLTDCLYVIYIRESFIFSSVFFSLGYALSLLLMWISWFMYIHSPLFSKGFGVSRSNSQTHQFGILEATIADRTRELRIMNQTLENLIKRDDITGLYNRSFFMDQTERWIQSSKDDEKIWMTLIDIDRFKSINDTYGHDTGDQILRLISKRLETLCDDSTIIARLGGDEFGIVCLRKATDEIFPIIDYLIGFFDTPISIGPFTILVSLSMGVSSFPDDASTRRDLMRHADIAMYLAKHEQIEPVVFFDKTINAEVELAHQIDLALKKACFDSEFTLVYQPQFAVAPIRLVGMEALIRWNSPELGELSPNVFIPIAEENGKILTLGDWIMRKAMEQIKVWNTRFKSDLLMGINISPIQLEDPRFFSRLETCILETGVSPVWLNLEVTERSAMKDTASIINLFHRFSELGIKTSIDDFGTGYSSLSYLKMYHINYLKIAKELIDDLGTDKVDEQIISAIVMMAKALDLKTIAEGVEDEDQYRCLEKMGCSEIQGFFFGKPVSPALFEELFLPEGRE